MPSSTAIPTPAPTNVRPVLRVVPAPRRAAPDPLPDRPRPRPDGVLPLEWRLPSGLPAEPPPARHLRLVSTPAPEEPDVSVPPPGPWAARLARTVIEVVSGERPAGQLRRWTTRAVHADLAARAAAAARHPAVAGRPPQCRRVRSVRVYAVSPTVVEACAVVSGAVRSRAVALRLEVVGDRWVATAVEMG